MKPTLIILAAVALVCGCSGKEDESDAAGTPATVEEAAKQAEAQGLKPQPGLYKTTITMTGLDIPGLPPGMEGHGAGLARTLESCLTQEEVDKGYQALLTRGQNGICRFDQFALDGGALDAVMVCDAQGASTRMAMNGTVSATKADITASTKMQFEGVGEGTMTFTANHERIGECPAGP